MILGIDEAGRGPWAGPLVVGAVVLGGAVIDGLTDSKKLTKKRREVMYDQVTDRAVAYASGWVSAQELDEIGMSAALQLATRRAVEQITVPYSEIIIDGTVNFLTGTIKGQYVQTMAKADLLVPSVSAASIIAKVERDRYMAALDDEHPGYGFGGHAGYGVAKHRAAIEELGVTPEHRLSFAPLQKYGPRIRSSVKTAPSTTDSARRGPHSLDSLSSAELAPTGATVGLKQSSTSSDPHSFDPLACAEVVSGAALADSTAARVPTTRQIGDRAEEVVAKFLQSETHEIIERNWKTKFCEIDIVSRYGDTMYFTEVKYRRVSDQGGGIAAVTPKKLRQMKFAAEYFALKYNLSDVSLRLAVAEVVGEDFTLNDWFELSE